MARPWPKTCDDKRPTTWDIGFSARRSGISKKDNPYRGSLVDFDCDLAYYWSLGWDDGGDWSIDLGDELC